MLDHLALLDTHAHHQAGYSFRTEQTHQVILERNKELGRTRVALPACTAAKLAVNPSRLVALGTHNSQTACIFNTRAQLDVCTTAGHIGSDGNRAGFTRFSYDIRFLLVQLGVQYVMFNTAQLK